MALSISPKEPQAYEAEHHEVIDETDGPFHPLSDEERKRLLRRIDRRLVLTLGFLYAVSLMDRNNTGIALVSGMGVDLDMIGTRYSIVVLVFFIPYTFLQPLATVVLRKVGPRVFLPATTMVWGLATIASGFVKDWTDLIPLRLILGACEAGFFPSCAYLLSCWYPRYDLQKRNAAFYLVGTMASAVTGILAYGFSQMGGLGAGPVWWGQHIMAPKSSTGQLVTYKEGIAPWRWIFIMQGVLTCVIALGSYVVIVGFPDHAKKSSGRRFLTAREAAFVVARIEEDRKDAIPEDFRIGNYLRNALDSKIWGFAALFGLTTTNTYAIAYFLPIILNDGMGFGVAASQCLITPPYVAAAIAMFTVAYFSDKHRIRSPFIIVNCCVLLIGLPLTGFVENVGARYFGIFLATMACNANVPCILTWQANNIRGQWKRAFCSATLVGSGGLGGIIGSTVFRAQDKPSYRPGIYATMISSALMILVTLALTSKFVRDNAKAAKGAHIIEQLEGFRYTL